MNLAAASHALLQLLYDTSPALAVVATLVLVLALGTAAQILAEKLRIPATGPLLIAGLIFGPAFIGLVQPEMLGVFLRAVIRIAVCIVIFEGGMLLDIGAVRQTSRAVIGLSTIGLVITTVLAALIARYAVNWTWELSFLFGAIVSVTGPTVITPILQRVRVNERVRATLETESVIADPLGVILASLVFTAITSERGWSHGATHAGTTLLMGLLIGIMAGALFWLLSRRLISLPPKFARLTTLVIALTAYTVAELFSHESGVLAAAIAGVTIGSIDTPYREQVREFKGDIASVSISLVFILLAASLRPQEIADLGWRELLVVVLLMAVVRPLSVFLATAGSELRFNEKLFASLLGPRGIVAASIATFFSLELIDTGYPINGRELVTLVFAVILGTVLIEGSAAPWLAKVLKVMPRQTIIVGADGVTRQLGQRLVSQGESVSIIDTDEASLAGTATHEIRTIAGDATDEVILRRAGSDDAKCLIAATTSDKLNLLVCHVARASTAIPRLIARANQPSNVAAFEAAGIEVMSVEDATATYLENLVLRPSITEVLRQRSRDERVAEVKVVDRRLSGKSLSDLSLTDVVVIALRRGATIVVPTGRTRLKQGDTLTLMGKETAVEAALLRFDNETS